MASAENSRPGRSTDLPAPRPALAPDGPVTVGSLLRREGRAAHSQDRPVVPRARDAVDTGGSAHRTAVTAGALLAVTAVLGTNAVSGVTFGPATGADDGPGPGRAVVPAPPSPLSLAATATPLGHAVAVFEAAGSPVLAAMEGPRHLDRASGAGIVAQALGSTPFGVPATFTGDTGAAAETEPAGDELSSGTRTDHGNGAATHRPSGRGGTTTHSTTRHGGSGSGDSGSGDSGSGDSGSGDSGSGDSGSAPTPPLHVPPVLVDPGGDGSAPAPSLPSVGESPDGGVPTGPAGDPTIPSEPAAPLAPSTAGSTPPQADSGTGTSPDPAKPTSDHGDDGATPRTRTAGESSSSMSDRTAARAEAVRSLEADATDHPAVTAVIAVTAEKASTAGGTGSGSDSGSADSAST